MQLTQYTDLGLRVVMRLAVDESETRPSSKEIAQQLSISYTHVAKVITRLSEMGIVDARRGRGGGLAITDLGRTATVGWITRRLEGEGEVVECEGSNPCPLRAACGLRTALQNAREAFFASLDTVTVSELTAPPNRGVLLALPGVGVPENDSGAKDSAR